MTLVKRDVLFDNFMTAWYESDFLSLREGGRDHYLSNWEDEVEEKNIVLIFSPVKHRVMW